MRSAAVPASACTPCDGLHFCKIFRYQSRKEKPLREFRLILGGPSAEIGDRRQMRSLFGGKQRNRCLMTRFPFLGILAWGNVLL